ncbi:MAG TPA: hypothetical protein VMR25_09600, partial [Planctomycetaceae bacterium]|nr:hypothetical protein [Planctomycetaceae bacterium]
MWIRKWERDQQKGVDSPIPTQVVSNEEFIPRPQTKEQRQWEALIGELAEEKARKLGMQRRDFMRTSMGMATAFLASNMVYGPNWEVDAAETLEPAATEEKWPKGEYFIMDVQTHFTDGLALSFRNAEFIKNMNFNLKNDKDAYSFLTFVKEIFLDSETTMGVISGVPGKENNKDPKTGKVLEGRARSRGTGPFGSILPSWLMSQSKKQLNDLAKSQRVLCQGNCAPNHYWDRKTNKQDLPALFEQMDREVHIYGID